MNCCLADINNFENYKLGVKARNLFLLQKNDVLTPQLICIPSSAFEHFLKSCTEQFDGVFEQIDYKDEMSLKTSSIKLRNIINNIEFSDEFKTEILKKLKEIFCEEDLLSVRSSSEVEDRINTSFAGQFDTYLNVSKTDIFDKVKMCLSSLFAPNVLKYCHNKNVEIYELKMNVIIQKMINADISGIAFTANPRGLLNEMVVVVGEGLGELIVEDKVPTTTYYYNINDRNYYFEKQEHSPVLSKEMFSEIIKIIEKIKSIFGEYLDIEFAISEDKIYILQTRPITTFKIDTTIIFDNSNIVESYPNITLPLTATFVKEAYYGVFYGLSRRILSNKTIIKRFDTVLREMVDSVNGRMYYNINNWYTLIKFLPFSSRIIPVWQEMLGVSNKQYSEEKIEISSYQKLKTYFSVIKHFMLVPHHMKKLNTKYSDISSHFKKHYRPDLDNKSLVELYYEISERVLKNWDVTLLNDLYAFIYVGLIKHIFRKAKIKNHEAAANRYISGITNIESIKPLSMLIQITMQALKENHIDDLKKIEDNEMFEKYLLGNNTDFADRIRQYIELYGDRSLEELKLESKTFRASPITLAEKIIQYSNDLKKLLDVSQFILRAEDGKSEELIKQFSWFEKKLLSYFSEKATKGIKNREISRLNRSRIYGMIRTIFLTIGENFYKSKLLDDIEDIFYLKMDEVFGFICGQAIDLKKLIELRKQEYRMFKRLPNNNRLVFANTVFEKKHSNINSEEMFESEAVILGTPCSSGCVTGEVVVVDDPGSVKDIKDKILVTKMTDPGWVFLITLAKGIIAEKGSLLSHTAIISRELNIPSIVGVKNITSILKTGDYITMNGNTGQIKIEKRNSENV